MYSVIFYFCCIGWADSFVNKRKIMYRLLLLLVLPSLLLISSCKKDAMTPAIITGFDSRMCACCGGLMITFTNDPDPYQAEFYLLTNEAAELGLSMTTSFPVYLEVEYEFKNICSKEVMIKKYKKL
jgi:hypothetical protein